MPGLRAAQQESDALELAGRLRRLERLAGDTARTMQSMAVELHPPAFGTLGLLPARQNHRTDWGERHSIDVDIPLCGARAGATSRRCRDHALPRDAGGAQQHPQTCGGQSREPHAGSAPGGVSLILEDDSAAFVVEGSLARPEKAQRLGIRGMRDRVALLGGALEIESAPARGTSLYVRLPDSGTAPTAIQPEAGDAQP